MKKSFISIIISITLIINIFACTNAVIYANINSSSEIISSNESASALAKGIKEILNKDVFKSAMGDNTIHEIIKDYFNQDDSNCLKDIIKKSNIGISITDDSFKTDENTYKWISNIICAALKNAINKGILKQSDIDQINSAIGILEIFGIKKISIDLNKKDYTDAEIEKITVELLPTLDKLLNPLILKFSEIDFKDKKFWDNFVKLIKNALK